MRFAFIAALGLVSCAANTGVVPIGAGSYMISKQAATGFGGLGTLKAQTLTAANAYCEGKGQAMQLLTEHETQPPYILANYPRAEITFTCDPR